MNKLKAFLTVSAGFTLLSALGCASSAPFVEPPLPATEKDMKVPGESLTEKLAWLESNAESDKNYFLEVNANENIAPRTLEYAGATNINIVIRGVGENHPAIRLSEHGTMFTIKPEVQLILENVTLMGHSQNIGPMINVDGGRFWMRTGTNITGNENTGIQTIGIRRSDGGGVYVGSGTFVMSGGAITGNTAENGGGVYVAQDSSFGLYAGIISGNTAKNGGGVYLYKASSMSYKKSIATITGNTAREYGGGLYVAYGSYEEWMSMRKGRLIVTGIGFWHPLQERRIVNSGDDPDNGNVVKDEAGNILDFDTSSLQQLPRGHAMFWYQVSGAGNRSLSNGETIGKRASSNNEQSDAPPEE